MSRNVRSRAWTFSKVRSLPRFARNPGERSRKDSTSMLTAVDAERARGQSPGRPGGPERAMSIVSDETPEVVASGPGRWSGCGRWCRNRASSARGSAARSMPSRSHVFTATSRESVESRPPEIPMFSGVPAGSCSIRLASPAHWIPKISAQRRCSSGPSGGDERRARHRAASGPRISPESSKACGGTAGRTWAVVEAGRDPAVGQKLGDVDILGDPVRIAANRLAVAHPRRLGEAAGRSRRSGNGRRRPGRSSIPKAPRRSRRRPRCTGPTGQRPGPCGTGSCRWSRCWPRD